MNKRRKVERDDRSMAMDATTFYAMAEKVPGSWTWRFAKELVRFEDIFIYGWIDLPYNHNSLWLLRDVTCILVRRAEGRDMVSRLAAQEGLTRIRKHIASCVGTDPDTSQLVAEYVC